MTNITVHLGIWAVLALVVVLLALYRKRIDAKADDLVHVLDTEQGAVSAQAEVNKRIVVIDRWGKALTVLAALYLLAIGGLYLYQSFAQESTVKLG
jgi:hypothetical protein